MEDFDDWMDVVFDGQVPNIHDTAKAMADETALTAALLLTDMAAMLTKVHDKHPVYAAQMAVIKEFVDDYFRCMVELTDQVEDPNALIWTLAEQAMVATAAYRNGQQMMVEHVPSGEQFDIVMGFIAE